MKLRVWKDMRDVLENLIRAGPIVRVSDEPCAAVPVIVAVAIVVAAVVAVVAEVWSGSSGPQSLG